MAAAPAPPLGARQAPQCKAAGVAHETVGVAQHGNQIVRRDPWLRIRVQPLPHQRFGGAAANQRIDRRPGSTRWR